MGGIRPALADLSFPRSAVPWKVGLTLTQDGSELDTTGQTARVDVATDATFNSIYFSVNSTTPNANSSSLSLDTFGDALLTITQADANLIPKNGVNTVASCWRFLLSSPTVTYPIVVGTLYAEPC